MADTQILQLDFLPILALKCNVAIIKSFNGTRKGFKMNIASPAKVAMWKRLAKKRADQEFLFSLIDDRHFRYMRKVALNSRLKYENLIYRNQNLIQLNRFNVL